MIPHATVLRAVRFAILLGAVVVAAMFFRTWDRRTIPRTDQSMDPTYPGGTRVMTRELAPGAPLDRGTDVVYRWEKAGTTYERFGRVQAIPGDDVGAKDGRLTVNGEPIGPIPVPGEPMGRVPEGTVLILAINPAETRYPDSRKLGFIPRAHVERVIGDPGR
jgi:Signal peptidase, peptidase S26